MPLMKMDGFDDCIAGVIDHWGRHFIVYDRQKVIQKLIDQGLTPDEAIEHHYFNQDGAWVGDNTPAFLDEYEEPADGEP